MMNTWRAVCVSPATPLGEVISKIDQSALQIAIVVDPERRLLGTVTDGDVRRGILRGVSLTEEIATIMNKSPTVAGFDEGRETILAGPTCDSMDILYEDYKYVLPETIAEGDRLYFLTTGAYTQSYSSVYFNGFPPLASYILK